MSAPRLSDVEAWLDRLYIAAEGAGLRDEDRRKAREVAAMLDEIERAAGRHVPALAARARRRRRGQVVRRPAGGPAGVRAGRHPGDGRHHRARGVARGAQPARRRAARDLHPHRVPAGRGVGRVGVARPAVDRDGAPRLRRGRRRGHRSGDRVELPRTAAGAVLHEPRGDGGDARRSAGGGGRNPEARARAAALHPGDGRRRADLASRSRRVRDRGGRVRRRHGHAPQPALAGAEGR